MIISKSHGEYGDDKEHNIYHDGDENGVVGEYNGNENEGDDNEQVDGDNNVVPAQLRGCMQGTMIMTKIMSRLMMRTT